jgi:hypothetical protein
VLGAAERLIHFLFENRIRIDEIHKVASRCAGRTLLIAFAAAVFWETYCAVDAAIHCLQERSEFEVRVIEIFAFLLLLDEHSRFSQALHDMIRRLLDFLDRQ